MSQYNREIYNSLQKGEILSIPSYMGIVPADSSIQLNKQYLIEKLTANTEFQIDTLTPKELNDVQAYEINIKYNNQIMMVIISQRPLQEINLENHSFANGIKKNEYEAASTQKYYLETLVLFNEAVFDSYLFQLKLLNTIAPEAYIGIDSSSTSIFSIAWMKMIIAANVPPDPSYLYSIKVSYNGDDDNKTYWYRTEGLLRCHCPELELVNIKQGEREMHDLLAVAAHLQLDTKTKENVKYQVGYDGMGLYLSWIRWENALTDFPPNIPGGLTYRQGVDNLYARPSGILYAVEDNNLLVSPQVYVPIIKKQPIFLVTTDVSARKKALAIDRWDIFAKAFVEFGKNKTQKKIPFWQKLLCKPKTQNEKSPDWVFLVKIGIDTHSPKLGYWKEHLWFEVLNIQNGEFTGKLCNKPYGIQGLKIGDIKTYSIQNHFSDWKIYDPSDYEFTPDSAYLLEDEF